MKLDKTFVTLENKSVIDNLLRDSIYSAGEPVQFVQTPFSYAIEVAYPDNESPTDTVTVIVSGGIGAITKVHNDKIDNVVWRGINKAQRCDCYNVNHPANWQDIHSLEQGHFFNPENRSNGFKGRILSVHYREQDKVLIVRHSSANYDGKRRYGVRLIDIFGESASLVFGNDGEYTTCTKSNAGYTRLAYTSLSGGNYRGVLKAYGV